MKRQIESIIESYERCHSYSRCSPKCAYYAIKKYQKPGMYDSLPCHTRMIDDISFLWDQGKLRFTDGKNWTRDEYELEFHQLEKVSDEEET